MDKWIFKREGKEEEVKLERWIWGVIYKDGTELKQFDDQGVFHQIAEIKQSEVRVWVLFKPEGKGRIDFLVPDDKEVALIHKYKNYVFNVGHDDEKKSKVYCFGYKVKGQAPHYNFVLPNDVIIQSFGEQDPNISELVLNS